MQAIHICAIHCSPNSCVVVWDSMAGKWCHTGNSFALNRLLASNETHWPAGMSFKVFEIYPFKSNLSNVTLLTF